MSHTAAGTAHLAPSAPAHRSRRMLFLRMLAGLLLLLIVVRLLLPWLLARAINQRLGALPAHHGVVGNVDLQLFRGAYRLHDFTIRQRGENGEDGDPLISVRTIDFSLAWRELLHGRVVADIILDAPILRLTRSAPDEPAPEPGETPAPSGEKPVTTNNPGWRRLIQDIFPIEITRLVIRDGSFDYADPTRNPPVVLGLANVGGRIEGLANRAPPDGESTPSRGELAADVEGGGKVSVQAIGFPLSEPPVFEAEAELDSIPLPSLNPLLRSALGVDVSAGTLHVTAEMRAAGGSYEGYVKPLVRDARFADIGVEPGSGPVKTLWESLVAGVTALLTNNSSDRVGTRVPFSGEFGRTSVDTWDAFVALLRNAFVQALREGADPAPTIVDS